MVLVSLTMAQRYGKTPTEVRCKSLFFQDKMQAACAVALQHKPPRLQINRLFFMICRYVQSAKSEKSSRLS
jgi:hypothetical protein